MRIFVRTPDDKTILLEVETSDTVLSVKMHIQTTEDITPNQQHLHLLGYDAFLLNDHTLSEYQIQDGAMLYLLTSCCRQIYVRTWDDETVILDVVPRDSIAFVKAMVAVEKGIPVNQQVLVFAGRSLEDHRTLAHYNLRHGATLYQLLRLGGGLLTL